MSFSEGACLMSGEGALHPHALMFAENLPKGQMLCWAAENNPWIKGSYILRVHQDGQIRNQGRERQVGYIYGGSGPPPPCTDLRVGQLHPSS